MPNFISSLKKDSNWLIKLRAQIATSSLYSDIPHFEKSKKKITKKFQKDHEKTQKKDSLRSNVAEITLNKPCGISFDFSYQNQNDIQKLGEYDFPWKISECEYINGNKKGKVYSTHITSLSCKYMQKAKKEEYQIILVDKKQKQKQKQKLMKTYFEFIFLFNLYFEHIQECLFGWCVLLLGFKKNFKLKSKLISYITNVRNINYLLLTEHINCFVKESKIINKDKKNTEIQFGISILWLRLLAAEFLYYFESFHGIWEIMLSQDITSYSITVEHAQGRWLKQSREFVYWTQKKFPCFITVSETCTPKRILLDQEYKLNVNFKFVCRLISHPNRLIISFLYNLQHKTALFPLAEFIFPIEYRNVSISKYSCGHSNLIKNDERKKNIQTDL